MGSRMGCQWNLLLFFNPWYHNPDMVKSCFYLLRWDLVSRNVYSLWFWEKLLSESSIYSFSFRYRLLAKFWCVKNIFNENLKHIAVAEFQISNGCPVKYIIQTTLTNNMQQLIISWRKWYVGCIKKYVVDEKYDLLINESI